MTREEVDFGSFRDAECLEGKEPRVFENVSIGPQERLRWTDEIEFCPDAVYMRLTGKSPDEVFPALSKNAVGA